MFRFHVLGLALAAGLFCATAVPGQTIPENRYDGYALVRIDASTVREFQALMSIGAMPMNCRVGMGVGDYAVSPEQLAVIEALELDMQILHDNVQRLIDEEAEAIEAIREGGIAGEDWFSTFRTWPEVNDYIDTLVDLRPDLVEKLTIGTTEQGRTIFGMRITGTRGGAEKPAVLFNGCQHAREWVAVMVPMYIADRLVRDYDSDPAIQSVMDEIEFFIVPIVNPDGYEYTYAPGGDRLWRKNRSVNQGSSCVGVDLNRNWDIDWNGPHSTSNDPCELIYVGPSAMSELEVQAMAAFIEARPQIAAHIDFHSFSQLVLQPWGWTSTPPVDFEVIDELGGAMSSAITGVHGEPYPHGASGEILYSVSGAFNDWTYANGALGYTIELRPATPNPGFILPPEEILPTCEENFAGAMAMAEFITEPIRFSFPGGEPTVTAAGVPTTFEVSILSIGAGPLDESSGQLWWRLGSAGPFTASPLTNVDGSLYEAQLPAAKCGATIEFYLEIDSTGGSVFRSPSDAPTSVYSVEAIEQVFADTFDDDLGWQVGAPGDDATSGIWERVDPIGTAAQPDGPLVGAACYVTGQHPGGGDGANDVDNGRTTLLTPVINLAEVDDAVVSYQRWYSNHAGASPGNDVFVVDVTNDGVNWVNVETVGPTGPETQGGWFPHTFNVADYVAPSDNVRLRFMASDEDPQALIEAAVDDFRVYAENCIGPEGCPADFNFDNEVNVLDLLQLLSAWGACDDCPTDLNGDEEVNVLDMLQLLSAWGACP